jgi:hypothetical protein
MNSKNLLSLLRFLVDNCAPLSELYQFHIIHSEVGPTHVSGASVTLESEAVKIFLAIEKEEIIISFCSVYENKERWHIFARISKLLGREVAVGIMNDLNAAFLRENGDKIMNLFSKENYADTVRKLDQFQDDWLARLERKNRAQL